MGILELDNYDQIHIDFDHKNKILSEYGNFISPWSFYELLFHGLEDNEKVMVIEAGRRFVPMFLSEAIKYGIGRSDVYISPAVYFQNYYKSSFLDKLFAIAVDLDNVRPRTLISILNNLQLGEFPIPTVITNSGSGVHFYYIFAEPLKTYRNVREAVRRLYNSLHTFFGEGLSMTQKHWMGQPYRIVGGQTKAGDITTAFMIGEKWTPENLSLACNSVWQMPISEAVSSNVAASLKMQTLAKLIGDRKGLDYPNFSNYKETYDFIFNNRDFSTDLNVIKKRVCYPKWYENTLNKVLYETQEGKRYSSLMALCVIAYKCGIDFQRLEKDIFFISDLWRDKNRWSTPFNSKNVSAALRMYQSNYVRVRRSTLEEWLGWEFKGGCKRNGRSQKEHLEKLALDRKSKSIFLLEKYIKNNPSASRKQTAKALGMSYNTVKKYYEMARTLAGIV